MADHRVFRPRLIESPKPPSDSLATPLQRYGALSVALVLVVSAACAALVGNRAGPQIKPFIAITATIWSLADILTAFLLLTQFYIGGRLLFAILSFAYGFSGVLAWSFIAVFPGIFASGTLTLAGEQLPSFFWYLWHCTFPILVACAFASDTMVERVAPRRTTDVLSAVTAVLPALTAGAVTVLAVAFRSALPHFVVHGQFQPLYRFALLPLAFALNGGASLFLLRTRKLTPLRLWLAVATFSACLDVLLLDLGSVRFSYLFDVGKLVTVFTGSIVLVMMLWDVIGMYGRLARVERIDALTSLRTRFAFEEHLRSLFLKARRLPTSLGLLLIAVDSFESYNDSHGNVAAEESLRRIARELLVCASRPADFVARHGIEDFVMVLPDMSLGNVRVIAERVRSIVEALQIVRGRTAFGAVTVSIGIAYTRDAQSTDEAGIFDTAERALEDAIALGRNRVAMRSIDPRPLQDEAPARLPVGAGSVR